MTGRSTAPGLARALAPLAALLALVVGGCSDADPSPSAAVTTFDGSVPDDASGPAGEGTGTTPGDSPGATPAASPGATPGASAGATDRATPLSAAARRRARTVQLDRLAGLRSRTVAWNGTGRLRTVPGDTKAPGRGEVHRVRVEVEVGLDVDRAAFADYVVKTLNDRRSWTEDGRRRFARTDGPADIRVTLASPATSADLCRPLRTYGKLSCRQGNRAVLTYYRWVKAIPEYASNRDGYRHYVVNHEVGHVLGHGHEYCPGRGERAPVMMQQTKGLRGCRPNPWPFPDAGRAP